MPTDTTATVYTPSDGSGDGGRLAVLTALARRIMASREAAEVVLAGLESIGSLVAYDYALLELIPGFGNDGSPTVFRATPAAIEAIAPATMLIDDQALLLPLQFGGRELGRLRVIGSGDGLSETDAEMLEILGGYMSLALKLAELETTTRRLAELEALQRRQGTATKAESPPARRMRVGSLKAELSQILSAQLGLTVLCERVLDRLVASLDVDAGALYIFDDRGSDLIRTAQRGVPGPLPARLAIEATGPTALGRAAAAGVPHLVRDLFTVGLESDEDKVLRTWGFHGMLCFPLLAGTRVVGGLLLLSRRTGAISADVLALLNSFGNELALALQNALTFDRLSTMAVIDALTGLHNRRFCEEFVRKHLLAAQRTKRSCGFLLLDIDHFKGFNDRFGHAAGDLVLRGVASVVLSSIRAADLAGRYGGEEFMVALPTANLSTAVTVADRIRANVVTMPLAVGAGEAVTVSIGASSFPECATTLAHLFTSADVALYAAKEAGRDRVVAAPLRADDAAPEV